METNLRVAAPSASADPTSTQEEVMSNSSTSDVSAVAGSSVSILNPISGGKEETKKRRSGPKFHPERDSQKAKKAVTKAADFIAVEEILAASRRVELGMTRLHLASKGIVDGTAEVGKAQAVLDLGRPAIAQAWKPAKLLLRRVVKGGRDFCDMWTVKDEVRTARNIVAHMGSDDAGLAAPIAQQLRDAVAAAEPASVELTAAKKALDDAKTTYLQVRSALDAETRVLNVLVDLERAEAKRKAQKARASAGQGGRRGKTH